MKYSIISTVYNKEKYLNFHIQSLISQNYENVEFIFVNDGSTDKSLEILKRYEENPKVKVISQSNLGPNIARKTGLLESSGDYIYFVDSDDILYNEGVIKNINKILLKNKEIDCLLCKMVNRYDNKDVIDKCIYSKFNFGIHWAFDLNNIVFRNSLCFKIFKKSKIKHDFFINERNFEDAYLSYKIINNCNKIYYCDLPIYIVNRCSDNVSITKKFGLDNLGIKYNILNLLNKEVPLYSKSINKLYLKTYLDDLNYSLSLSKKEACHFLFYLKKYKKRFSVFDVISFKYFKKYLFKSFYQNWKSNIVLGIFKNFEKKIKTIMKRGCGL
jgi:glycosyltransferase involved in cell wall biosynthesis